MAATGDRTIHLTNHGPLILETNYWESELASAGKLFVSVNAGAIRILLPASRLAMLAEMRTGKECILSIGPWPAENMPEGVEIIWDDRSGAPFALHLTTNNFDMLPAEPPPGQEWTCSVWINKDGKPHKALERICHWRRVPQIPYMKAWRAA